jgi:hypothetical protein
MHTSNHSSRHSRLYWLTDPGKRLACYLDYVDRQPMVATDIQFGDTPERHDEDRRDHRQEQLDRLYEELYDALEDLRRPNLTDSQFEEFRLRVKEIRMSISEIETGVRDAD